MILDEIAKEFGRGLRFIDWGGGGGGGTIKQKTLILFSKWLFCVYKQVP